MKQVFVTGADRGVGFALCRCFLEGGYRVFAGQYMTRWKELEGLKETYQDRLVLIPLDVSDPKSVAEAAELVKKETDRIDILVNCAGITGGDEQEKMRQVYRTNTLGAISMVENFLPLMDEGEKRLCFVSSEAGSVSVAHRTDSFAYCMSKTSLNMAVRLMFNRLRKDGYTFRLYHPGWVKSYMMGDVKSTMGIYEPEEAAATAYKSFTEDREWEDVLVMTDVKEEMWPF